MEEGIPRGCKGSLGEGMLQLDPQGSRSFGWFLGKARGLELERAGGWTQSPLALNLHPTPEPGPLLPTCGLW